ncbi:MAG TPA: response regulator [Acidobacteriaceae bacterium]|nr:response regulator [Acidobacteriaceae bacterium]
MSYLPQVRNAHATINFPVDALSAWPAEPESKPREQTSKSAVSPDRSRILSIGDDPLLLHSRRLVLERDGYLVAILRSEAIMDDAQLRGFDLVMLCHSIPDKVASHILEVLWRVTPQTPVLLVSRLDVFAAAGPHHTAVSADPAAMLEAVAQQLAIHKNAAVQRQVR